MAIVDNLLNRVTLYRLMLYYLAAIAGWAVIASALGLLDYEPVDLLANVAIACGVGYALNKLVARILKADTGWDSNPITALILVLIVPVDFPENAWFLAGATALAVLSKYFVTVDRQHMFNPAAAGVLAVALLATSYHATWWVGSATMLPVVAVGGLLLLRKLRRNSIVYVFLPVFLGIVAVSSYFINDSMEFVWPNVRFNLQHTAALFFALVMLTEPSALPATSLRRLVYTVFVAALFAFPQTGLGGPYISPEAALCLGNILGYVLRPKFRFELMLTEKRKVTPDTYIFDFGKPAGFMFTPGQYMEWIVPHSGADSRGTRRYFTIASSPTEDRISVLVKAPEPCSSYKRAMVAAVPGDTMTAFHLTGDFTMPRDVRKPLAFIAGGVGIAPFAAMVRHMFDTGEKRDIVLLYVNRCPEDIACRDVLERARAKGVRTVYVMTRAEGVQAPHTRAGRITAAMLREEVPDLSGRKVYVAGPDAMVLSTLATLRGAGVRRWNIVTDYFQGYAPGEANPRPERASEGAGAQPAGG
ncbi:MAG: hypothetical protein FJ319_09915 [SAR202 cluster bacterium]|nr:hypothetical protein [SAR202 cluster bacterium]